MKYTATLSAVQVGQAVKSLLLLGERKITKQKKQKKTVSSSPQQPKRPFQKSLRTVYHEKE